MIAVRYTYGRYGGSHHRLPAEEGIDYPEGETCPLCPFWKGRDRWTAQRIHQAVGCCWMPQKRSRPTIGHLRLR
jgi:hypothetical protein